MPRQVIACDFDDVLMNFNVHFVDMHNRKHGTNVLYEHLTTYQMEEIYKCSSAVIIERVIDFYSSNEHAVALPIAGSVEALQSLLQRGYTLDVVTSRPESVREQTHRWIQSFFPDTFRHLHFTNGFGAHASAHKRTKSEICHEIGAKVLIEDALKHAAEVAAAGIPVLMPDRPWNRSETPEGVLRVQNYQEIHDWIVDRAQ